MNFFETKNVDGEPIFINISKILAIEITKRGRENEEGVVYVENITLCIPASEAKKLIDGLNGTSPRLPGKREDCLTDEVDDFWLEEKQKEK